AQGRIVFGPVGDPAPLFRDAVTTISIGLERHGESRVTERVVLLRQLSLRANRPIRATNSPGIIHQRHITGSGRASARHPAFRWANTLLANIKNSVLATHRAVEAKHLPRYLGAFAWRFNRRFVLKTIHERLAIAAAATPPMPYRLLKLAEARW